MNSKKPVTYRNCKDCKAEMVYVPRRIRCMDCYKKNINKPVPDAINLFIPDDD